MARRASMKKRMKTQNTLKEAELSEALMTAHMQIGSLENQLAEYKWLEESLRRRTKELNERTKELQCLSAICERLSAARNTAESAAAVCELLPAGFQFPQGTWVNIEVGGEQFFSRGFKRSKNNISCAIRARGEAIGAVSVHVSPVLDQYHNTAILREECLLLETTAALFGKMLAGKLSA